MGERAYSTDSVAAFSSLCCPCLRPLSSVLLFITLVEFSSCSLGFVISFLPPRPSPSFPFGLFSSKNMEKPAGGAEKPRGRKRSPEEFGKAAQPDGKKPRLEAPAASGTVSTPVPKPGAFPAPSLVPGSATAAIDAMDVDGPPPMCSPPCLCFCALLRPSIHRSISHAFP